MFPFCKSPVDPRHKLNVHKAFRRRPVHLLNVLCTFNVRLVSTGKGFLVFSCVIKCGNWPEMG